MQTMNTNTEATKESTLERLERLKAEHEAYFNTEVTFTAKRHCSQPQSWIKENGKWLKVEKKEKQEAGTFTETLKVHSLPKESCSKCQGRGHRGIATKSSGKTEFVLCKCVK